MKIKFCGAAKSVTGSCHMITTEKHTFLLDCGQFQGSNEMEELNQIFEFDPTTIDFVLLSHAHIDHSGRLPLLVKRGFKGKIYCTDPTADLLNIMLLDSAYIHEKEAEWANRKNQRAGRALVEPLYTSEDAENSLKQVTPILYDQLLEIDDEIKAVFNDAGHILGSSIIEIFVSESEGESKLVFSGDLGMKNRPILRDPTIIKKADYLIMETTYGNRVHEPQSSSIDNLFRIIERTVKRGGTVVIPSFAVGRTQELIYEFSRFYQEHDEHKAFLDNVFIYVDSPLATSATEVFRRNVNVCDDELKEYILKGDNPLDFKNLVFTRSSEESIALNTNPTPKVIISASGMCDAGRIKHHLKHNLWNPKSTVVFVGYQAEGTLGKSIVRGDKDVSIFGEKIHVEAEIFDLQGFSGHADKDALLEWLSGFEAKPAQIFLVHGEEESKEEFAGLVKRTLGYDCVQVKNVSEFTLTKDRTFTVKEVEERIASPEALEKIKAKLTLMHTNLDDILYNAEQEVGKAASPERIAKINNIILDLEKDTMNLGMAVTKSEQG